MEKELPIRRLARDKIQDEHDCLSFVFHSLKKIHKSNGFDCTVLGTSVRVKVWIHFFIGDTEGNNKLVGQYRIQGIGRVSNDHILIATVDMMI